MSGTAIFTDVSLDPGLKLGAGAFLMLPVSSLETQREDIDKSEILKKYQKRFIRYQNKLFVFLEQDGISWNNNMAERALRHLAVQRKISGSFFKKGMIEAGFDIVAGDSAIVPVMLYDAKLSQKMADMLLKEGIYVIGFYYPVVPQGEARIRVQLSAAHDRSHLDQAISSFVKVGKKLGVVE